ncbi:MAG: restriction endonuclease subunit S [Saprospiraceae bacterium]|nr:restriction endonuclease subunit S [Saprospiraceae bacterium]
MNRNYLAYYFSTPFIQNYFTNQTRTVSQPTLNIKQIEETKIILPPLPLQQKFASIVEQVEQLRVKQRESERELENLFGCLMQRYFGS